MIEKIMNIINPDIQLRPIKQVENPNQAFPLQQVQKRYPNYQVVSKGNYYPYNQIYQDHNWGCAWRAIQLVLSVNNIESDFKQIFHKYSRKNLLLDILKKKLPKYDLKQIKQTKFAPQQNQKNWAQPFIGQLICENNNLKTKLFLVNGCPKCYAPQEVFQETVSFEGFWQIIKKVIPDTPIMIDDGQLALSIVGYHQGENNKRSIILADPHIYSNRQEKATGIYQVVLDEKGNKLQTIMSPQQQKSMTTSHQAMSFAQKKWMAMYAQAQPN